MANELKRDIKYINRDFNSFRSRLIDYSKTYFPQTFNDFTPVSLGMMFMEQASYVGDVLSFYLDNQIQENFIQYARQSNNIFELAYMLGYKPKLSSASQVVVSFYQQIPSKTSGSSIVPDFDYALSINENTQLSSISTNFILGDKIDFSVSSSQDPTEITVYQISGNQPQYYLLKKNRNVISSTVKTVSFSFTTPEPFTTVNFNSNNFIKILDIKDSDGNLWYEVDHLGQEMVFNSVSNTNINYPNKENNIPYILKLLKTQRRFSTRIKSLNEIQIQFGVGSPNDTTEEIVPNPNNVGLGLPFKQDKLTSAYSPTNFLYTGTYGIAPANTTLTVRYLEGGGVNSNVEANTITNISNTNGVFFNKQNLNSTTAEYIFNSVSVNNLLAATGGKGGDTLEEIRQNTLSLISSQKRSVTSEDYLIRALSMPSDYGSVTKAYIEKPKITDRQISTIETLCLYVLTQNSQGQFDYAGNTLKQNLRTYLSQYRIIGDNIEIKDAYIINIGIEFEIIVLPNYNNNNVLTKCISSLQQYFNRDNWQLNQPIFLKDLFILLDKIEGVQTVKDLKIFNKAGTTTGYSQYAYDIDAATQFKTIYPSLDPSIFEVRYPNEDIKGRVVPL
tara:strand:- start:6670 stop:8517 length:1848 start_codon:yes stop_codon:yes gene_type:complete